MGLNQQNLHAHKDFWKDKRVLITGHTGFKGSWLTILLNFLGSKTFGLSLKNQDPICLFEAADVVSLGDSFNVNINSLDVLKDTVRKVRPEIVFHMAAESLVRRSYKHPLNTFNTNVIGTANLLEVLREIDDFQSGVFITTDKVYKNDNSSFAFNEESSLGGHDPYSSSKAAAEMVIGSYRDSYFFEKQVAISSARAGNVIGGGDWSEDRLFPDLIRSEYHDKKLRIRNPKSTRPWQHVLDPLIGYLELALMQYSNFNIADSYNFGPKDNKSLSVEDILLIANASKSIIEDKSNHPYEAQTLSLDVSKSSDVLGFECKWNARDSVSQTLKWFRDFYEGEDARKLCLKDIDQYLGST